MTQYFIKLYDRFIEKYPQKFDLNKKILWINRKDDDGFTPLHYAVFRRNYRIVKLLVEKNKANIFARNNQGFGMLHIAAQADSPPLIYYFIVLGIDIQMLDNKGNTALHWSCYMGNELSAFVLMAFGCQLNTQQKIYGMTALHLAVLSKNSKIVKKLLLKGANRLITNNKNKLAIDEAIQHQYSNITEMILDGKRIAQFCNLKIPYRKTTKYQYSFYFLIFVDVIGYLFNCMFVIPNKINQIKFQCVVFIFLGLVNGIIFLRLTFSRPGYIRKQNTQLQFQNILFTCQLDRICFDCKIIKPPRSRHCQICQRCICVYDHHCPWVGNCVGAQNYLLFFIYLLLMELFLIETIIFTVSSIQIQNSNQQQQLSGQVIMQWISMILSLIISSSFIFPVSILFLVHIKNTLTNRTTFQRYSFQPTSSVIKNHQDTIMEAVEQQKLPQKKHIQSFNIDTALMSSQSISSDKFDSSSNEGVRNSQKQPEEFKFNPIHNTYMMCFGNKKVSKYWLG